MAHRARVLEQTKKNESTFDNTSSFNRTLSFVSFLHFFFIFIHFFFLLFRKMRSLLSSTTLSRNTHTLSSGNKMTEWMNELLPIPAQHIHIQIEPSTTIYSVCFNFHFVM